LYLYYQINQNNREMSKVLGFMKQVARGLQVEGNFGTAHVYRSSLNAIIAYRGMILPSMR
jgi:recombinational DNA repair protein RecT